jgi:hypothetical protein
MGGGVQQDWIDQEIRPGSVELGRKFTISWAGLARSTSLI